MGKISKDREDTVKTRNLFVSDEDAKAALCIAKKAIIKKYGNVISSLEEHGDLHIPTISTGCLSLDSALGNGGMGLGRIYEIFGPNSGGKSTLATNVVIQAQRRGFMCCYIDAEQAVDPKLFKNYGVDLAKLEIAQGYDGEENLDILEKLIKTGAFRVAVIDSVSALLPRAEAEADIDKDSMALQARLMSKALRKITPIANQTNTLLIFINQLRMKVGGYGNPETTSGGEGLAFYATGRISVRGPESKARRLIDDNSGEVFGHKAEFEVIKNKLEAPFKKANVNLIYGKGYDSHWEILDIASGLGIIEKVGSWYKLNGENIAQGELKAIEFLKSPKNIDVFNKIKDQVIAQTGLKEQYELHSNPGFLSA
jgi:recombination protein RecA